MKKAYSYARFSNPCQAGSNSLERQLQIAQTWYDREIKPSGISLAALTPDTGHSAFKGAHLKKGRGLGDFLIEIREGRIDPGSTLICENLDRISRQGPKLARKLLEQIVDAGVDVHVCNISKKLTLGWEDDLSTSVVVDVELGRAQKESQYKSERIGSAWRGKKLRAENGKVMSETVPWWLEVKDGKIVPHEEKAGWVREMFRLATIGLGSKNIIRKLGIPVPISTVSHTLRNRRTLGEHRPTTKGAVNGTLIPDYYPRIITAEEFDAARQAIESRYTVTVGEDGKRKMHMNGGTPNPDDAKNLFSGLVFDSTDPEDSRGMQYRGKGYRNEQAIFRSAWRENKKSRQIRYARFEEAFLHFLLDVVDWKAVAGSAESEEQKRAAAEFDSTQAEVTRTSLLVEKLTAEMDNPEGDLAILSRQLGKAEAKLAELRAKKAVQEEKREAARSKSEALYSPEVMLDLIRSRTADNEYRLRLKAEIARRIQRIAIDFTLREEDGVRYREIRVTFINNHVGLILLPE